MKTIALIEDTLDHLEIYRRYVADNFPDLPIVGEARTVTEAYELLSRMQPDILISDIQIMGGTSFDALARLDAEKKPLPYTIFVTGHGISENVTRALRFMALDFLTKPVAEDKFCDAINYAITRIDARDSMVDEMRTMLSQENAQTPTLSTNPHERMVIKLANGIRRQVPVSDILYFRADREMTTVYLTNQEKLNAVVNLGYFTKLLRGHHDFLLVHQSSLVNAFWIKLFNPRAGEITLSTNERIAISKTGTAVVRDYIKRKEGSIATESETQTLLEHITRWMRGNR